MYGKNPEAFISEVESEYVRIDDIKELEAWRKYGPIGKLHNTVTFIRRTPQRREAFQNIVMHDTDLVAHYNQLQVVADNATRWNSMYSMTDRALKLKDRIKFYLFQNKDGITHGSRRKRARDDTDPMLLKHDILSKNDWTTLKDMYQILETFQQLTLRIQGRSVHGERGVLWEYLSAICLLMQSSKEKKRYYDTISSSSEYSTPESRHLSTSLGNAWLKLTEYFQKMGDSPVYIDSCVLNPKMKWKFFEKRWENEYDRALQGQNSLQNFWNSSYKNQTLLQEGSSLSPSKIPATNSLIDDFDRYITVPDNSISDFQEDSYASYCREPVNQKFDNLLYYWRFQEANYPDLAKMAYDMHSIPATFAECERVFSSTKLLITDRRALMRDDIMEASECLKA